MGKRIRNNGNIIRIVTEQGYCSNNVHITKAFFENEELKKAGFTLINDGFRCMWTPTEENIKECIDFGKEIAKACE